MVIWICGACSAEGDIWGEDVEVNRRMEKIVMGFRGMGFEVHVVLREIFRRKMEKLRGGCREM